MSSYTQETLPDIISAAVLKEYLGISRAGAYNILNSRGFPTLIIGNRKLVMKKDLLKWLEKHKQPGISIHHFKIDFSNTYVIITAGNMASKQSCFPQSRKGVVAMSKKRSNGDGTLRKRSDGRWECRVMNGTSLDGKPKYKTFYGKTQKEVREKLKKFQANLADGIVDSGVTFEQWADNWFNGYKGKVSDATYEGYRYTVRILKNYFGKQLLKDIRPMHVEMFLEQQKSEGRSDSYVAKLRGMLFQILNKAEANDLVRKNPVRYAEKRRTEGEAKPKDAFTAEEIRLLFAQLPMNRIGLSIRIMIATGLRSQEMLALQTEHVEPDDSVIHVRQAVKLVKGTVSIGPTKSRDSVRDVPVPESVRQYVVMLLALQINGYLWGSPKTNTPVNPSWFRTSFEAELAKIDGVRKLTPHCCRHTYVSHLQAMGVDIQTIQYLSGHAEIKMTEHYLHVQNSVKTKAVEKFDTFLSAC